MLNRFKMPRLLLLVMGASVMLNLCFSVYRTVFNNFAGQELGIQPGLFGLLEGIREIPGLLTILLVALVARLSDERLYMVSAAFMALGMGLYAGAHTYMDLVTATLIQSVGFHCWSVVQDAMIIKAVATEDRAHRLGLINSGAAVATLIGMGAVYLAGDLLPLRTIFLLGGVAGLVGMVVTFWFKATPAQGPRQLFVFRWQYRSYYVLTLLSGARRHVVLTFASFLLVKLYGASVQTMALIFASYSFAAIFTRPWIGRIIGKVGEQRALSINYALVAAVFVSYAFVRQAWLIYSLFIFDNVLTGFDIAVSTHAGRIIPKAELSSSLATGSTINHIFGVMVPMVGGFLWQAFGPTVPFLLGAGLVLIAMGYSWNLDQRVAQAQREQLVS